jgi:hypothetical protein
VNQGCHRRVKFVLLKGPLDSKGFIMVKTPGYCNAQLLAPMLSSGMLDIYYCSGTTLDNTPHNTPRTIIIVVPTEVALRWAAQSPSFTPTQ